MGIIGGGDSARNPLELIFVPNIFSFTLGGLDGDSVWCYIPDSLKGIIRVLGNRIPDSLKGDIQFPDYPGISSSSNPGSLTNGFSKKEYLPSNHVGP